MSRPINKIFYFSLGRVTPNSKGSFLNSLDQKSSLAAAMCGIDNDYLVLESSQNIEKVFHNEPFENALEEFFLSTPWEGMDEHKVKKLLISAYKDMSDEAFCEKDINYFCADCDDDVINYSPAMFVFCKVVEEFDGAFYNSEYCEVIYELEKHFSLFSLRGRLDESIRQVYGIRT